MPVCALYFINSQGQLDEDLVLLPYALNGKSYITFIDCKPALSFVHQLHL